MAGSVLWHELTVLKSHGAVTEDSSSGRAGTAPAWATPPVSAEAIAATAIAVAVARRDRPPPMAISALEPPVTNLPKDSGNGRWPNYADPCQVGVSLSPGSTGDVGKRGYASRH